MFVVTDADNRKMRGMDVPASELRMHSQALRLNAGRALKWEYIEVGDETKMLILCSSTQGAIVYPWKFDKVHGLNGVFGVLETPRIDTIGPSGKKVYAVSRFDSAFVMFFLTIEGFNVI